MIIVKFGKKINQIGSVFVGYVGLIGILVATAGVVTRFILKISISWSDELLRTVFIWGYFIGAALCFQEGGIMRLEFIEDSLLRRGHKTVYKWLRVISAVINAVFFGVSTCFVGSICMQHIARGTTSGTSNTPAWVLPASYGVGCLLITVFSIRDIVVALRSRLEDDEPLVENIQPDNM